MDVLYWKSSHGNFGDDLNEWIWDELLPGFRSWDTDTTLTGVGTLLNPRLFTRSRSSRFLVAGTGVGYGAAPTLTNPSQWDIRSLRGPRSARALGLSEELGIIDPAIMLSEFAEFRGLPKTDLPIFVPHWSSIHNFNWELACKAAEVELVLPNMDAKKVIRSIAAAPLVLAESMHAAIIADTFRVPWIAVSFSPEFNGKKWLDWADSLEINPEIHPLCPVFVPIGKAMNVTKRGYRRFQRRLGSVGKSREEATITTVSLDNRLEYQVQMTFFPLIVRGLRAAMNRPPTLSSDSILERQKARYFDVIAGIIRDYDSN